MQYEKLEILKMTYPKLAGKIKLLISFLEEKETQEISDFRPENVSKKLNVSDADSMLLLYLAEKQHVIKRSYQAYSCDDDFPLEEFKALKDIREVVYSPAQDKDLSRDEFYIDLIFRLQKKNQEG